ncbi:MAG: hypothetical protein ACLQVD_10270 [Capsulimonadaceae bacterium]
MKSPEEPAASPAMCVNHKQKPATHTCYRCNRQFCFDCVDIIKGRYVCVECDAKATRLAAAGGGGGQPGDAAPGKGDKPIVVGGPKLALSLGLFFGIVGQALWEKVSFAAGTPVDALGPAVGFGVGVGVAAGSRKRGWQSSSMAVLVAFVSFVVGHYLLVRDFAAAAAAKSQNPAPWITLSMFEHALSRFPVSHWLFVALAIATAAVVGYLGAPAGTTKPGKTANTA